MAARRCAAESRNDFIHKLRICLKELRESRCWLRFIIKAKLLPAERMAGLVDEADQLCNIVGKSILTARRNDSVPPSGGNSSPRSNRKRR